MKRTRFTEAQIAFVLKSAEAGVAVGEVWGKAGISEQTYYRWKQKYCGMLSSEKHKQPDPAVEILAAAPVQHIRLRAIFQKIHYQINKNPHRSAPKELA